MNLDLKGKVAIVTGASRGIGKAIALALAEEGASLALCSRTEKDIRAVAKAIAAAGGVKVYAVGCDLTQVKAAENLVRGTVKTFGRVDILVNNVGGGLAGAFETLSEKDWEKSFDQNLRTALRCCRAVIPVMKKQQQGAIINIAALSGKVPRRGQIASNLPKAALISLTESLAAEIAPYGIRVNAVCPAAILTERWQARIQKIAEKRKKDYETTLKELAEFAIPVGRFGVPEDVASLVAFLASEKSGFINGVSIEVDGGLGRTISIEIAEKE